LFCFFISGEEKEVSPGSCLWEIPLSGENKGFCFDRLSEEPAQDPAITVGDYYTAACQFLSGNDFLILKTGLAAVLDKAVLTDQIRRIIVSLEKHGAFYHPLKVQVALSDNSTCYFVLNGAVSRPGLNLIEKEYQLLASLNKTHLKHYLPPVFGVDVIKTDTGRVGFFLGEWFDGYKEFHVTRDKSKSQVVIWESDGRCHYISQTKALPIYHEISRILTYYYDIETFEQIFPWHHAAGDFVVKKEDDKVHVRLITVRGYSSLTEFGAQGEDSKIYILPSLLIFFLTLTLRIRLDRLNGTGKTMLLGEKIVTAAVEGFFIGLDEKTPAYDYGNLKMIFIEFFKQFDVKQVAELLENILATGSFAPSELLVIQENLESHGKILDSIFKTL